MNTTKLVLVRHGESEWNKSNLFCGWHDADLSDEGLSDAQTISCGALIKHEIQFDVAFHSPLKRAKKTLDVILNELHCANIPTISDWRLSERHYGNLTGFNKRQVADKYGEKQVQIWRRSFDICPPPIEPSNPYYDIIRQNPIFKDVPEHEFPNAESLCTVMRRVAPFWDEIVLNYIGNGQNILIVSHGTVLRGIVKHIEGISDEHIRSFNMPNSIPCVYTFNVSTRQQQGEKVFLADDKYLKEKMDKVAAIGK